MKSESYSEQGNTNARLTKDFLLNAVKDPEFMKGLPQDTHLIFVPTDNKEAAIANLDVWKMDTPKYRYYPSRVGSLQSVHLFTEIEKALPRL